jgi:threonine/homoserine/homoserine lactone efflux protein
MHLTDAVDAFDARLEQKLHPHSAFWIGFVRVMANPGVLLFWIILAANFVSRGWVTDSRASKLACIGGVALGVGSWFIGLSWIAARGYGKMSERTLLRMEKGSGIALLVMAFVHAGIIIAQMTRAGG